MDPLSATHRRVDPQDLPDPDTSIRQTDSDAALARLSAVQQLYLQDPFIRYFVPSPRLYGPRPPLINIGTYVRSEAIDHLVYQWLASSETAGTKCQIVSFGAGSDTRFWRISTTPHKDRLAAYVELDFVENTTKKVMAIRKSKELSNQLSDIQLGGGGSALCSSNYHIIPVDLRLPPSQFLAHALTAQSPTSKTSQPLLSPSLPTLLLFECVLVYMPPDVSSTLIKWFVDYFADSGVLGSIVYEMFGLEDSFGKVMLNNLKSRNVVLPGVVPYPTLASLPTRFTQHGFTSSHATTLREIRKSYISEKELNRIASLEMLDEVEELELVLEHYALTWGIKLPHKDLEGEWNNWGLKSPFDDPTEDDDDEV